MHVVVLGAGLTGVTAAWYLRQAGHHVTVVDRQPSAALETSFANGGQISVSHPEPWANPGAPRQVLRWLGREDAPLLFRPTADWHQWTWGLSFLIECLPGRTQRNTEAIAALAVYSRERLRELRERTGIQYDHLETGILHLFFDRKSLLEGERRVTQLARFGIRSRLCNAQECLEIEPALTGSEEKILGGLYAPDDESGDARTFTQALAKAGEQAGIRFRYNTPIVRLVPGATEIRGIQIAHGGSIEEVVGDAYLLCLGSYSTALTKDMPDRLPIYPVKGYSVTLPLAPDSCAPRVSITDESRRIVCSRLGNRLRIAGTAELAGYNREISLQRCRSILERARILFPNVKPEGEADFWAGLRPATPSNRPLIGRSRYRNLYLNTGHGTLGWTLACGSGAAIAAIVSGRRPEVDFPFREGRR